MRSQKDLYWHGSVYLIADDLVLPGDVCGRSHFQMDRSKTVFVSEKPRTAVGMGGPVYTECYRGLAPFGAKCAPYLYLVEPKYMFARDSRRCHSHILGDERQCRRARIVRRFLCEDIFKDPEHATYIPMGDYDKPRITMESLEQEEPTKWLPTF